MSLLAGTSPASSASSSSTISPASSNTSTGTFALTPRLIAIIGASVGGAAVLLAFCLMVLFILDRRRYRRQVTRSNKSVPFSTDFFNEKGITPQVIRLGDSYPTGLVKAPVDSSDLSSENGYYDKISLASWSQVVPEHQYFPPFSEAKLPQRPSNPFPPDSPNSFTVPQPTLLQPSTIIRSFTSRHRAPSNIPDELLLPPTISRSLSGRHLRAPSDVPADLSSRCSTVSSESYYPSISETETKVPLPAVIAQSLSPRGLPSSPRDGLRGNISRENSRATSKRSIA